MSDDFIVEQLLSNWSGVFLVKDHAKITQRVSHRSQLSYSGSATERQGNTLSYFKDFHPTKESSQGHHLVMTGLLCSKLLDNVTKGAVTLDQSMRTEGLSQLHLTFAYRSASPIRKHPPL